jgi:hypothetical protein
MKQQVKGGKRKGPLFASLFRSPREGLSCQTEIEEQNTVELTQGRNDLVGIGGNPEKIAALESHVSHLALGIGQVAFQPGDLGRNIQVRLGSGGHRFG